MRLNAYYTLLISGLFLVFSCKSDPCGTKDGFLEHFDGFTTEFEAAKDKLDDESKLDYENKYKNLVNNCYKKHKEALSLEEKQDFWKKSLAFYVARYDGQFSEMLSQKADDPFNQYLRDEIIEVVKESGMGFVLSLQSIVKDELPKLIELFSKEMEKLGKDFFNNLLQD